MKASEKAAAIRLLTEKARKRGIPINVRTGGNEDLAEWLGKFLEELLEVDEPIGFIQGDEYDHCPACGHIVGQSAYFCKYCGSYLRYKP